jgi:hypothetical protein
VQELILRWMVVKPSTALSIFRPDLDRQQTTKTNPEEEEFA